MQKLILMFLGTFTFAASCAAADAPTPPSDIQWYVNKDHRPVYPPDVARLDGDGVALLNQGKYRAAIKKFDAALKRYPKGASLHQNRGMCYMALGQYDAALADFNKTLALEPDTAPIVYRDRADCYKAMGKPGLAVADYTRALAFQQGPEARADMLLGRGRLLVDMNRYADASKDFMQVKHYKPLRAQAYSELAYIAFMQQRFQACQSLAGKGIAANPKFVDDWVNRATCELMTQEFRPALKDLSTAIRLQPDMVAAHMNRAAVYVSLHECSAARQDAEKVAQLAPEYADAAKKLAAQCSPAQPRQ